MNGVTLAFVAHLVIEVVVILRGNSEPMLNSIEYISVR